MTGQERREKILAILEESGTVNVSDLAGDFDVSEKTIRRDLDTLEGKGLLVRFRGGAKKREPGDISVNQMRFELSEEAPVRIVDEEGLDVTNEMESFQTINQAWVVKTSRPDWIVKAIKKNRPGTIVEPMELAKKESSKDVEEKRSVASVKEDEPASPDAAIEFQEPKKDLNVIEVGAPIKPETLAELIKLADPESKKTMPIPSYEATQQATAEDPESLPKKRDEEKEERPRRTARTAKPAKTTGEVKASEPKKPPKSKKATEPRKQTKPVAEVREDKQRKADRPARPRKKREEQEETAPKKVSKTRKFLDVVYITIALICFIGGAALAIYILVNDRVQGDIADVNMMHEVVTHEDLSFYVPENWNVLERGGNNTIIRIRDRQGDIIGAMTISTHAGNLGSTLEANFDEISARIHQGVTDLQSDVKQFGNTPTRRHSYTDLSGERGASLNTFLIPSGENIKYIQLRKPIEGFSQELLTQFNEIVGNMNFQPSEFSRE